jgi:NADH dehydrogenase (ubiquinone) Fe-S protein 3
MNIGTKKLDWLQKQFAKYLQNILPALIQVVRLQNNDIEVIVAHKHVVAVLLFLKYHTACQFDQLIDIVTSDNLSNNYRFTLRYLLLSLRYNARITVVVEFDEMEALETVTHLYSSAE